MNQRIKVSGAGPCTLLMQLGNRWICSGDSMGAAICYSNLCGGTGAASGLARERLRGCVVQSIVAGHVLYGLACAGLLKQRNRVVPGPPASLLNFAASRTGGHAFQ